MSIIANQPVTSWRSKQSFSEKYAEYHFSI
jgi:hypothetical protein